VKTCTRGECAELFSLFSPFDGVCQSGSFLIQRNRNKRSTRKFEVGVFTQPGPEADIRTQRHWQVRTTSLAYGVKTPPRRSTGGCDAAFNAAEATFDTPSGARSATRVAHQKFGTTALAGTATPIFEVTLTADIAVCLSENVAAMGAASLMLTHRGHKWLRANRANFSDRFRPWLGRIATFASIILVHNQLACGPANRRTRKTSPAGAGSVVFKQTQAN
jgi:hypothetical protein